MASKLFFAVVLVAIIVMPAASADEPTLEKVAEHVDVLEVTESITLDPLKTYGRLVVKSSGITIDGNGAWLIGNADRKAPPSMFKGEAIRLEGVSNVTVRNVNARAWETGLHAVRCESLTVEDCNFSDNFHDPDFGWGENGRRGGLVFEQVHHSVIRRCRVNRVWDACVLVDSNKNAIENNDFSFTSNTCLKLWTSCDNSVNDNNLSHGIRISPGEVHARDSTSVLIESGSNRNIFYKNDCTFGGDGIFIRVLNGWCSTDNQFVENDCSWANNNGIECWSPRNVFIRNKANHCSYGFWLGGSNETRLFNNEASYNGLPGGQHNSPHLPDSGHAGIVFMFGSSSHVLARGNVCRGNNGAGIALIGDLAKTPKWKAYHWILEGNVLESNRWGIYAKNADWIVARKNQFRNQAVSNVLNDDGVTRWTETESILLADGEQPSLPTHTDSKIIRPRLTGPKALMVGESGIWKVDFDARVRRDGRPIDVEWDLDLGQGTGETRGLEFTQTLTTPGLHRIAVNVTSGDMSELASQDVYVVRSVDEHGTEAAANDWKLEDFNERQLSNTQSSVAKFSEDVEHALVGKSSLHVQINPYAGARVALTYPKSLDASWSTAGKSRLTFWLKSINSDVTGWQGGPFFILHGTNGESIHLEPQMGRDLMREMPDSESREGWRLFEVPLSTTDTWKLDGTLPASLRGITISFDSWGAPPLELWIDGLALE